MKISKVVYELYQSDYSCIRGSEEGDTHEIDREIRIEAENGERIYISWTDSPAQYSVGYKTSRWSKNDPEVTVDVSHWKVWQTLIAENCELIFHGDEHQVLEIRCPCASVYVSSQENGKWFSDVLHISSSRPKVSS